MATAAGQEPGQEIARTYQVRVARAAGPATYELRLGERMTVLDALFQIQAGQDSTLAFRCACRVGMCGTCAMQINRVPRLACKARLSTLGTDRVHLAPLPHLPVVQDLVVSLEPFFDQWKRILPALRGNSPESGELRRIPPDPVTARKRDCITCGICYAACGIKATHADYLGPAAINRAFLRLRDPRDQARAERRRLLDDEWTGVWRCHTQFNCTAACPKNIDLTDTILRMKRELLRK